MKKNKIFLKMAALAVMGTMMSGCAEEIEALQTANQTVIQKFTISLADDAGTRGAITIDTDSKKGITTFSEGDMIAVIYQNANGKTVQSLSAELTPADLTDEGASATFTVELNNPLAGGYVRYIYPASMAAEGTDIVPGEEPSQPTSINYTPLATQDGTLETIASSLGLAVYDGQMSTTATLPTGTDVKLENQLAIGKFTIKNGSGDDITSTITSLSINDGYNTYTVTTTTQLSTFYVAMQPITSTQTVILNATDGTNHYTKSVTNNPLEASKTTTLEASKIYDIAVTINNTPGANLSAVTADYIAQDGEELTGTLGSNVKLSIAAGATVTLNGVTINGVSDDNYNWAGITCEGDATIILAEGLTNTVKGFSSFYPGIFIPVGKTLTIQGDGSLDASNNGGISAGIGAGCYNNCGNIEIQGGNITATSSEGAGIGAGQLGQCGNITISGGTITATSTNGAGIGGGAGCTSDAGQCGNITISGGTITATSSNSGAGIGGGDEGPCGDITITNGITKVTATKGSSAQQCIGKGESSYCGTVTFGTATVYTGSDWTPSPMVSGSYGGLNLAISTTTSADDTWTLSYNAHSVTNAVPGDLGKLIGADGKIYATMAQASAAGTTAVAMIAYVGSETGSATYNHGLAIALTDATTSYCVWAGANESAGVSSSVTMTDHKNFLNGIADTETLVTKYGAGYAAYIAKNYGVAAPTGTSGWFLPSSGQWLKFFEAAGVDVANWTSWNWAPAPQADNWTKINNLLTAVGSSIEQDWYWSSSESNSGYAVGLYFNSSNGVKLFNDKKDYPNDYVRSFLAF